jgi:hypothetical protein
VIDSIAKEIFSKIGSGPSEPGERKSYTYTCCHKDEVPCIMETVQAVAVRYSIEGLNVEVCQRGLHVTIGVTLK